MCVRPTHITYQYTCQRWIGPLIVCLCGSHTWIEPPLRGLEWRGWLVCSRPVATCRPIQKRGVTSNARAVKDERRKWKFTFYLCFLALQYYIKILNQKLEKHPKTDTWGPNIFPQLSFQWPNNPWATKIRNCVVKFKFQNLEVTKNLVLEKTSIEY